MPESLHFAVPDCRAHRDGTALEPTWVWGLEIMAVGVATFHFSCLRTFFFPHFFPYRSDLPRSILLDRAPFVPGSFFKELAP